MENLSLTELAQQLYLGNPTGYYPEPSNNKLFQMLYNAYCRTEGISKTFSDLSAQDDGYNKACSQLFRWYTNRYSDLLNMSKGTKGQKRRVSNNSENYTFNLRYNDNRQFRKYLLPVSPATSTQDFLSFILHTAVAFMVPLKELDEVLQHLGFHPLHVKNIHHLSIAYVLLMADSIEKDTDFNPFAEVHKLHITAHEILNDTSAPTVDACSYDDLETKMIRDMLLLRKGLASQNFEALVARNRAALNMRHSKILSDFHRLSAVFIHIFDSQAEPDCFEFPEEDYSLCRFVQKFCKENLIRKKFRSQLMGMVAKDEYHPTRNLLILLWLYTYCFAFLPGVNIDKNIFRGIARQLRDKNPKWAEDAKIYYQYDQFDVYGFITEQHERSIPRTFRGSDLLAFINDKLMRHYGWGPINNKIPFDYYIHCLKDLTIESDYSGSGSAFFDKSRLKELEEKVDNVPYPLAAVTRIFEELSQLHAVSKKNNQSVCPLNCSLYEKL